MAAAKSMAKLKRQKRAITEDDEEPKLVDLTNYSESEFSEEGTEATTSDKTPKPLLIMVMGYVNSDDAGVISFEDVRDTMRFLKKAKKRLELEYIRQLEEECAELHMREIEAEVAKQKASKDLEEILKQKAALQKKLDKRRRKSV